MRPFKKGMTSFFEKEIHWINLLIFSGLFRNEKESEATAKAMLEGSLNTWAPTSSLIESQRVGGIVTSCVSSHTLAAWHKS